MEMRSSASTTICLIMDETKLIQLTFPCTRQCKANENQGSKKIIFISNGVGLNFRKTRGFLFNFIFVLIYDFHLTFDHGSSALC